MTTTEQRIHKDRLRQIDARLVEIEEMLKQEPDPLSYKRQELESEQRELRAHKRVTENRLSDLTALPTATDPNAAAQRERYIAQRIQERRESINRFISRLEAEGDHRAARIWRMQLLDLRGEVERELEGGRR